MWNWMRGTLPAVFLALLAGPLPAQGITNAVVSGNVVTAQIQLPGGISADLALTFEQAQGLDLSTLGLSADLVDPTSQSLQGRISGGSLVGIPSGFPVLVRVRPASSGSLAFHGVYTIALHTENLAYAPGTPLRLYRSPDGGTFKDLTDRVGAGSYRVRGTGGSFSEFLIVTDLRNLDSVVFQKFDDVQQLLTANAGAISAQTLTDLRNLLSQARTAYASGATAMASQNVQAFLNLVVQHSGADIPDLWSASGSSVNVAGSLRSSGSTLLFSIGLKAN